MKYSVPIILINYSVKKAWETKLAISSQQRIDEDQERKELEEKLKLEAIAEKSSRLRYECF